MTTKDHSPASNGQDDTSGYSQAAQNPIIRAVNDGMLEGLGQLADYFGYNRVMGKMYGALLLSPRPMSLDDMMDHLDVSKASVSMNMRMLENLGIVREVWVRGDRRKYYEAESDFWKILTNVLGSREMRDVNQALEVIDSSINNLRGAVPTMSPEEQGLAEFYVERIDQMKDFFKFAKLILTTIIERDRKINVGDVKQIDIK
ncbi:MAG: ArsR family transcriptional regulator [Anaerolinea sp.]|nr:ArsR family transcriptional regulator [Anaerolinea sp.]MCC6973687.1 ArsR family transcriptional regulator [Anaerolineae bacterium]CAG0974168.1 HTH-type transcriptional regulator MmpR5 [Anaerolineae bacterium]